MGQQAVPEPIRGRASTGRGSVILAGLVIAGVLTLSASQPWIEWSVGSAQDNVHVTGQQAVGVVQAYGLSLLAIVAVMALAGVILARVLAVVEALLGAATLWSVQSAWQNPLGASLGQLAEATGVSGPRTLATLIGEPVYTAWVWVAVTAAVLIVAHAVWALASAGRWHRTVRRFQKPTAAAVSGPSPVDAAESAQTWDAISVGLDPTDDASRTIDTDAPDTDTPNDPGTLEPNPRPRGEQ